MCMVVRIAVHMKKIKYPRYYEVNDIPVVIMLDGEDVVGKSANGMPYPIGKTYVLGHEISRDEYVKLAKTLYMHGPVVG